MDKVRNPVIYVFFTDKRVGLHMECKKQIP